MLSHKFHGKTSGKMKTEKKLLKLDEEIKVQHMLSTDHILGANDKAAKKARSAHGEMMFLRFFFLTSVNIRL
jgi:U4/U6.U5 tri-snRNP-associated protein 1